jgi:hypothetical protein
MVVREVVHGYFFPVVPCKLRETLTVSTGNCSCSIVHAQYENHDRFPGHTGNVSCFSEIFMVVREKISMNNFLPYEEVPSAFPYYHENAYTFWDSA